MSFGITVCRAYVEKGGAYATDCGIMLGPLVARRSGPEELERYHHDVHELQGCTVVLPPKDEVLDDHGAYLQTPL